MIGEHNICIVFFIFLFIYSFSTLCLLPPVLPPVAVLQVTVESPDLRKWGHEWLVGCRSITCKSVNLVAGKQGSERQTCYWWTQPVISCCVCLNDDHNITLTQLPVFYSSSSIIALISHQRSTYNHLLPPQKKIKKKN